MSADGYLEDESTRHAIYVQLYAMHNLEEIAVFITKAIDVAKSRVSDGLSACGTQQYERQIQVLQRDLSGIYAEMKGQMQLELGAFAGAEAKYSVELLGQVVRTVVQLNTPSPEMISAAAKFDPMALEARKGIQQISISGALDEFGTKKAAEILSEIQIAPPWAKPRRQSRHGSTACTSCSATRRRRWSAP